MLSFTMNETKVVNNFKSYIEPELHDFEDVSAGIDEVSELKPKLLPGELVVAEARNVLMYAPVSERNQGTAGLLVVTNFKLSFITVDHRETEQSYQQNALLGELDVCLSNIATIYTTGDKKRKLIPGQSINSKVKGLLIVCKNMRLLNFDFKQSPIFEGKKMANAILHHAFPTIHSRLFAYDYSELDYPRINTTLFNKSGDWRNELSRLHTPGWRVSLVNHRYELSRTLPGTLIVPAAVLDAKLLEASRYLRNGAIPIWVWGTHTGCALVRMGEIHPSISDRTQENVMLEQVRSCRSDLKQPEVMDLSKDLPSVKEVYTSYIRFRDLCTPDSPRQFGIQDSKLLSFLDHSKWLHYVSACLSQANKAADYILDDTTVVLQEGDGRDMVCLISSLTQILLDPYFRTTTGFQSLIQKEWVAMGHPFSDRLGHVTHPDNEQSPLFLLFLDCVWQITQQLPSALEMSETYLTSLWDAAHITIFDTFLFNCESERDTARKNHSLILRSVWDWGEQFNEKDIALFTNPLFTPFHVAQRNSMQPSLSQTFVRPYNLQHSSPLPSSRMPTSKQGILDNKFSVYSLSPVKNSPTKIAPPVPPKPTFYVKTPKRLSQTEPQLRMVHPRLTPSHKLINLEMWSQCYFRFIPLLEIKNGGRVQIDIQNRVLVGNINELYQKLSSADAEVPKNNGNSKADLTVNSFFPFSQNGENSLADIIALNTSLREDVMFDSQSLMNAPD